MARKKVVEGPLVAFESVRGMPLRWVQPKWTHARYLLMAGDAVVARLSSDGGLKTSMTLETTRGRWQLDRRGFVRMETGVWAYGSDVPLLRVEHRAFKPDRVTLPDGRVLDWTSTNFWATHWSFFAANSERPLVTFRSSGGFKLSFDVTIGVEGETLTEMPLLLGLGLYLITLHANDTAATTAVIAAT